MASVGGKEARRQRESKDACSVRLANAVVILGTSVDCESESERS